MGMKNSRPFISREQILALRTEAAEHGDLEQVALCDRGLSGDDPKALNECVRVILDTLAQQQENA